MHEGARVCVYIYIYIFIFIFIFVCMYIYNRSADKSLARPERKQATATEDYNIHISYLQS